MRRSAAWLPVLALALLTAPIGAQGAAERARELLLGELEAVQWDVAARLLEAGFAGRSALRPFDAAQALADLSRPELNELRTRLDDELPPALGSLLDALSARAAGEWATWFADAGELLASPTLAAFAADQGGRDAIRLARMGRPVPGLLEHLHRVEALYAKAAWACTNTGLAQRLFGDYAEARRAYERALAREGRRAAWILNELGLVAQAAGRLQRAGELLREGTQDGEDPNGQDTCRGNLARLLIQAAEQEPKRRVALLAEARDLLQLAIQRDATRTRARYWLARVLQRLVVQDLGREPSPQHP